MLRADDSADFLEEFERLYRSAGGAKESLCEAVHEIFAAYEQAKVFAADFQAIFVAERERGHELSIALEQLRESHEQVVRSEDRFRSLVLNSSDAIVIVSAEGVVTYASPSVERLWGYRPEELLEASFGGLVHPQDRQRFWQALEAVRFSSSIDAPLDMAVAHADGSWRQIEAVVGNLLDSDSVGGIVLNARDVTDRRELERQLAYQAFHDPLTGLPNRALFMDRLEHALTKAERNRSGLAVLFIDVDRFKTINDSLGHSAGDELLAVTGDRLVAALYKPYDTVARFGGDEFAVLLEDVTFAEDAAAVAARIVKACESPLTLQGSEVTASVSVGLAHSRGSDQTSAEILRAADIALYQAKRSGRGQYTIFDPKLDLVWLERLKLERDIRGAVGRGEIMNYYQPIIDLATGAVIGVEALARWNHPERGIVPPDEFISVAEEIGEIPHIGGWVLTEACRQLRSWQTTLPNLREMFVSVNVSPLQLQQADFADDVAATIAATGIDARFLQLEITESVLMENGQRTIERLEALKRLGVQLAIDDFGTGFSSLGYLSRLPIDVLKVDRSFVSRLGFDSRAKSIVAAVLMLAKGLNLTVTAEGVETEIQERELRGLGCVHGQGYLFSQPMNVALTGEHLRSAASRTDRSVA